MSVQPQGPDWWQASDGRWYPPQAPQQQQFTAGPGVEQQFTAGPGQQQQFAAGPGPQQQFTAGPGVQQWSSGPPPKKSSGKGCLIAALVVIGIIVVLGGIGIYLLNKAADTIGETLGDGGIFGSGSVTCPTAADIEATVGSEVRDPVSGSLVGTTGCAYLAADQESGVDVNIVVSPTLIVDEQLTDFADEGQVAGAAPKSIDVGERGQAWASDSKSAAIAVGGGRVVLVEIMSASGSPIGDKTSAAVSLLSDMIG